jgi:CRP/FNR family transcriptional regulator, cyclic AMP receptor protein
VSSEFTRGRVSQELEHALRQVMKPQSFPTSTLLFRQGMPASGIHLVEKGSVRILLAPDGEARQLIEVVGPGTFLGLAECMARGNYRVTAESAEPVCTVFAELEAFTEFLAGHPESCMEIVRLLSDTLHGLYHKFRSVSAHPGRPRRRSLNQQLP